MMIANATLVTEAVPVAATAPGSGTAATAGEGGGLFQQLLQGMQPVGSAETAAAATAVPAAQPEAGATKAEVAEQMAAASLVLQETAQEVAANPAPQRSATGGARLQLVMTWQALKSDLAAKPELGGGPAGAETTLDTAQVATVGEMLPEATTAVESEGDDEAPVQAASAEPTGEQLAAAVVAQPAPKAAAVQEGAVPRGLEVAAGKVEAARERRGTEAAVAAGANALSKLDQLQQRAMEQAAAKAETVQRPTENPVAPGADQIAAMRAGSELDQKVEQAELPQEKGRALTGATEGAQQAKTPQPALQADGAARPALSAQPAPEAGAKTAAAGFVATPLKGAAPEALAPVAEPAPDATQEQQAATGGNPGTAEVTAQAAPKAKVPGEVLPPRQGANPEAPRPEAAQATERTAQKRESHHVDEKTVPLKAAESAGQPAAASAVAQDLSGAKGAPVVSAAITPAELRGAEGSQFKEQGHRQQGQEGQNAQLQGAAVGAQGSTAETAAPESNQTATRSALHEHILSQVKEGVVSHDGKGNGQMSIRLNPGELGELKIQVRMEDNRLKVEVQADNRMVKDLLMSNLDSLKEALSGKNLAMDGFNVSTGSGGFQQPLYEERGNQRQQSASRFARGGGYGSGQETRVNYLTAEVNNLLDVRF